MDVCCAPDGRELCVCSLVLCGQIFCCAFVLLWQEKRGKIQMLLEHCHYYPQIPKIQLG